MGGPHGQKSAWTTANTVYTVPAPMLVGLRCRSGTQDSAGALRDAAQRCVKNSAQIVICPNDSVIFVNEN